MKKNFKRILCVVLCASLLMGFSMSYSGFFETYEEWEGYFEDYKTDGAFEILFTVGADDTQRNISWYSAESEGSKVLLSENEDLADAVTFNADSEQTLEGDYTNRVTVTGLENGKTYYYKCVSGEKESDVRTFSTMEDDNFSAMFVTDIHIQVGEEGDLSKDGFTLNDTIAKATGNADLDLIITAGDNASNGLRSEYQGLSAALGLAEGVPVAMAVGNHDRKGIAYKYFTNQPNQYEEAKFHPYISYDYYFVKGDALFLMFDSNCAVMSEHRAFAQKAIEANPDVKWRVAVFHHELYGGRLPHRESEITLLRTIWSPIIDEFKVDLALLGHSHYYSISDVVFNNKDVTETNGLKEIVDPKGTIFMVSGSINNPRTIKDGEIPPLGTRVGHSYLTEDPIYNILNFTDDSIEIVSYTTKSDVPFESFKITKTTNEGGHPEDGTDWYDPIVRFIADVYGKIAEIAVTNDMLGKKDQLIGK